MSGTMPACSKPNQLACPTEAGLYLVDNEHGADCGRSILAAIAGILICSWMHSAFALKRFRLPPPPSRWADGFDARRQYR